MRISSIFSFTKANYWGTGTQQKIHKFTRFEPWTLWWEDHSMTLLKCFLSQSCWSKNRKKYQHTFLRLFCHFLTFWHKRYDAVAVPRYYFTTIVLVSEANHDSIILIMLVLFSYGNSFPRLRLGWWQRVSNPIFVYHFRMWRKNRRPQLNK